MMRTSQGMRLSKKQARSCAVAAVLRPRRMMVRPASWSRGSLGVHSELTAKGRAIVPQSLKVERIMGEGSFGQVFQGTWKTPAGEQRVVLKRVKAKVEGAAHMGQMELLLNAYAAKVAKNHCADFLGYCEVMPEEATNRLTPGLWLMWKYEGSRTLAYYLRRRDTLRALASDLEVPEEAVVATVMKQLFEGLAAFHAAGLVHRDVKPLNIIFAESTNRFKLIDLGACADLRTGTNYSPEESILDPNYCPPEQYVLPTDSPHLAKSFLKLAISPMLWAQHKPDRFDMWSAGVTLLQLAIPSMRQDRQLKKFNTDYGKKYDYDLDAWRAGSYIPPREFDTLDAEDGAGWELAKALLRPRSIRTLVDNTVVFVNDNSLQRISAGEALRHRFMRQAREPGSIMDESIALSSGSNGRLARSEGRSTRPGSDARSTAGRGVGKRGSTTTSDGSTAGSVDKPGVGSAAAQGVKSGTFGAAVGLWRNLTNKLFDLEANILVQASATEKQSTVVKKLQAKAAKGQVSKEALQQEERKLNKMEKQLEGLQDDFNSTANAVGNVLGFLGFGPTKSKPAEPVRSPSVKEAPASKAASVKASRPGLFGRSQSSSGSMSYDEQPTGRSSGSAGGGGGSAGVWAALQQRLSDLEVKLSNQLVATEKQEFTVRKLRVAVDKGDVDSNTLRKAEVILQRMERRVNDLDQDLKQTRQEATGLLGLLSSGINQAQRLVSSAEPSPPPATPPKTAPAASSDGAAAGGGGSGQKQAGGFGGFFNRMFGGAPSKAAATPAPPPVQAAAQPQARAPAPTPARGPATPSPAPVSASTYQSVSTQEGAGLSGAAITEGASSLIANSLKFTGMAAKVALGMAAAMKADAEKALKEMEVEAEAKRQRKLAEQAFLRMLGSKEPPMEQGTTFAEVEAAFGQDPRYLAVREEDRPLLVATFVDALLQAQQRTQELAAAKLRDLFSVGLNLDSSWEAMQAKYGQDTTFLAVEDPTARQRVYEEVMVALRSAEDSRLAAGLADQAFIDLLQENASSITPDTNWGRVKPLLWRDYRYLALAEPRRRELFAEMHNMLVEAAAAKAATQEAQVDATVTSVAEILLGSNQVLDSADGAGATTPDGKPLNPGLIEELRSEQARLRSEYDAMERKLRQMEAALASKERAATTPSERAATPRPNARTPSPRPPTATTPTSPRAPSPRMAAPSTPMPARGRQDSPGAPGARKPAAAGADGSAVTAAPAVHSMHSPRQARITTPPLARGPSAAPPLPPAQESQLANSLMAAGVMYKRLEDGTLVFSFDENEPESSEKPKVGASSGST